MAMKKSFLKKIKKKRGKLCRETDFCRATSHHGEKEQWETSWEPPPHQDAKLYPSKQRSVWPCSSSIPSRVLKDSFCMFFGGFVHPLCPGKAFSLLVKRLEDEKH